MRHKHRLGALEVRVGRHNILASRTSLANQRLAPVEKANEHFVDGVPHEMTAGSFMLVPRGKEHYVEPLEAPCVNIDYFVPPRTDMAGALDWLDAHDA